MRDGVLLDTHALIWWLAGSDRISRRAVEAIEGAERGLIAPITFWEVSMLVTKGRIVLDWPARIWANDVLATRSVELADLTPTIAIGAGELVDFHGDPADRFIYAMAADYGVTMITKDDRIRD